MGCLASITIDNPKGFGTIAVPCGRCPGCRDARAASWAFRLKEEEKRHQLSSFVTLTYDDDNLKGSGNGLPNLVKKDLVDFFKRLRYNTNCKTIKYYACGEYGGQTLRPHYHGILFDATNDAVTKAWTAGSAHFGEANARTMSYVTKYICKPKTVGLSELDDRQAEFALMSKGMGLNYLDSKTVKYHQEGQFSFITLPGGIKQPLPRYFRDKIFTEAERDEMNQISQAGIEKQRRQAVQEAGSEVNYIRNRGAGINAAIEKFKNQRYTSRKTL